MSEGEVDALGPDGQAASARVDRDRRAPRFSWTPAYETTFFRSLCESVQLGLREHNSFKAEAWERAAQALQATHGAFPAKSHLINKSDNARKRFRLWRGLREDPEFIYNEDARTVTATEEAWGAHIKVGRMTMMTVVVDVVGFWATKYNLQPATSLLLFGEREMLTLRIVRGNPCRARCVAGRLSTRPSWRCYTRTLSDREAPQSAS